MNNQNVLNTIKSRRKKCVAIALHKGLIYYAISGDDINPITNKVAKDVEKVIGRRATRCSIEDSFTMIAYYNRVITDLIQNQYRATENCIYNRLNVLGKTIWFFEDYLDSKIQFKPYMRNISVIHSIRNYSCVERKIIGKTKLGRIQIYVGTNPCYYCLPVVRNVKYLSRETKTLTTLSVRKYGCKFTFRKK